MRTTASYCLAVLLIALLAGLVRGTGRADDGLVQAVNPLPGQTASGPAPSLTTARMVPGTATSGGRTTYHKPAGPPRVDTGLLDHQGNTVTIACATCHGTRPANFLNRRTADLDVFHQGLWFEHGTKDDQGKLLDDSPVSCLSCHNPLDYGSLRLANGTRVEFTEVMQLCSQCHGTQYRSYRHGAHGGMNGSWSNKDGERTRNTCTSCHDPHAPKYRGATPVLPPADRFLPKNHDQEPDHE